MRKKVLILSGIIALIDQLIKLVVVNLLSNDSIIVIKDFLNLTYVENEGAAWGVFSGNRWALVVISILAFYAIIKYFLLDVKVTKLEFVSYGLLLGGMVGNMIDRIFRGYVVDYVETIFGTYHFPVFNLADSAIVIGTTLIIIHLIRNSIIQRRTK
jgi:signal peptidase II